MAAATYSFVGKADMKQHNEQVEKAKKEVKSYADEVKKAQKETDKLSKPNFNQAFTSQRNLQNTVKTTTNIMNGLSGNMMGAIGKFGPYAAAAVAAFKLCEAAINKARAVNEDFNDSVGKLSAQLKGSFDEIANRITRMDFSNLLSGLATAAKYAGNLYDALDRAGTFKTVANPAIGEIQNTITALRIQIQELQVQQRELKKQGKDYSDIEKQIKDINAQITVQLNNLKKIYEQEKKNAYRAASDAAAYMGVNNENISGLYGNRGVLAPYMNVALAAMNGAPNYTNAQYITPEDLRSILDPGKLVNFIANEVGSPLLNETQNFFKQLLDAWNRGDIKTANSIAQQLFGINATQMNDTLNAINEWVKAAHSRMTEGTNGNLTTYTNQLNEANAVHAAYLAAQQQHVGDKMAQVRVQWNPTGTGAGGNKGPDWAIGSIAEIDDQIKKLKDRLANEKFDLNTQIDVTNQIEELENKKAMLELQVTIGGDYHNRWLPIINELQAAIGDDIELTGAFGSLLDGVLQSGTVEEFSANMVDLINKYFQSQPEFQLPPIIFPSEEMEESARQAMENMEQIIEEEYVKICEEIRQQNEELAETFDSLGTIFSSIGSTMGGAAGDMVSAFGNILGTIGTVIAKLVALAEANGVASAMELPWPANLTAVATVISGLMSAIAMIDSVANKKYASGGIVEAPHAIGDMNMVRVNAGEMILNGSQQARLFHMLNGNIITQPDEGNGHVEFRISGTDLVGILSNNEKRNSRIR